jgi:hypothetical protein
MSPQPPQPQLLLPDPPGRWIQKINAILHDHDGSNSVNSSNNNKNSRSCSTVVGDGPILSYVFYMCFWCTIFGIVAPIVVFVYLPIQCTVQILRYLINSYTKSNTNYTYDLLHPQNSANKDASVLPLDLGIVITGCDTGFGKELALYAANELGYTVFAGCLQPQTSWNEHSSTTTTTAYQRTKHGTIVPIAMDVTNSNQVSNVVRHVQQWLLYQDESSDNTNSSKNKNEETTMAPTSPQQPRRVLHALINNAGVGRGSIIDWSSHEGDDLSDYQHCMNGMWSCFLFPLFIAILIIVVGN